MKKIQLFLVMLLVSCLTAVAQDMKVTGKVTDSEGAVIGATVRVSGTTPAVIAMTDVNGDYEITIPAGAKKELIITFVGMKDKIVAIKQAGRYNVVLETEAEDLDDVVAVGYGSAKKITSVVGTVAKIDGAKLADRPAASALDALQGAVSGLQVYTSSGEPGTVQSVRLHGIGSLTAGSTPLYVVDGIPAEARSVMAMNPNDFESVTVLKDASATSIYGSKAANGVIYYTTKRGKMGQKAKIRVSAQMGISSAANKAFYDNLMSTDELFDFWAEAGIRNEAQITSAKKTLIRNGVYKNYYDQLDYNDPASLELAQFYDTNWSEFYLRDNRPMSMADISIQGGKEGVAYYVSASQYSEKGIAPGSEYERFTVRSNIDARINSWAKFGLNLSLSTDKRQTNQNWGDNNLQGGLSYLGVPYGTPYSHRQIDDPNNPGEKIWEEYEPAYLQGLTGIFNPYYLISKNSGSTRRNGIAGNVFIEIEPLKNLKFVSKLGMDANFTYSNSNRYPSMEGNTNNNGYVARSTGQTMNTTITNTLEYGFELENKDHKFNILVGQEGKRYQYEGFSASSTGQTSDSQMHLNEGTQKTYSMSSSSTESRELSFFAGATYMLKDRYIVDATVRNDANSRFSKENRNGTFWSVGARWMIKKEDFMKDAKWLNDLNLKVSYGTSGNSSGVGDFQSISAIGSIRKYNEQHAWALLQWTNPDLKWETQKKLTVALNATLWKKLSVGIEYYNRITDDMLMAVPYLYTTGFSQQLQNVGALENNGVDVTLNYHILQGSDYYLSAGLTFGYNQEKVTRLFNGLTEWEIANTGVVYVVGKPVMFYYPIWAGIDPDNGKQMWYKPSEDYHTTTKDPNNVTYNYDEANLKQNTGKRRYAPIAGGFNLNGQWKGISLNADFAYVIGKYLLSNDRFFGENPIAFAGYNTSKEVNNYWREPGDNVLFPDWTNGDTMQFDDHLLENASFLRLKTLTVSYSLPQQWLNKTNIISGVRVFFTGRNLFTVTHNDFKGIDPEVDANLTVGGVVNTKQFTFGLELTF